MTRTVLRAMRLTAAVCVLISTTLVWAADRIVIPQTDVTPGLYSHTITTPSRASRARVILTRPVNWPAGDIFTYTIYERERNGLLVRLTGATEAGTGGPVVGRDGTINPPLTILLTWPTDRDKDEIRFDADVLQTFTTAITVEFLP